jgi:hypothetical protein
MVIGRTREGLLSCFNIIYNIGRDIYTSKMHVRHARVLKNILSNKQKGLNFKQRYTEIDF